MSGAGQYNAPVKPVRRESEEYMSDVNEHSVSTVGYSYWAELFRQCGHPLDNVLQNMRTVSVPIMDCERCKFMRMRGEAEEEAGLHCYMFRDKPDGDRCGQMKIDE